MKVSKQVKKLADKVIPDKVRIKVKHPPFEFSAEWMPKGVAAMEGRKRLSARNPERRP